MIEEFNLISDYCNRVGKSLLVRNHAFCLFVAALDKALKDQEARTGIQAKPKEVADKRDALLTDDSIIGFVTRADHIVDAAAAEVRDPYKQAHASKQFWMSVGSSVLASFIYSLLLLVIFWIGRDQIATWLQSVQAPSK